jgi:hypothetical protein
LSPDDRRAAALVDQPREQRQQQAAADALVLPIRRDIEGEHLAGEFGLAAAPAAAAEAEDAALLADCDPHIARLAFDDRCPADLAPLRRQADQKRRRQNPGISGSPGFDIEPGDAARIARARGSDRDLVHRRHCARFCSRWGGVAEASQAPFAAASSSWHSPAAATI